MYSARVVKTNEGRSGQHLREWHLNSLEKFTGEIIDKLSKPSRAIEKLMDDLSDEIQRLAMITLDEAVELTLQKDCVWVDLIAPAYAREQELNALDQMTLYVTFQLGTDDEDYSLAINLQECLVDFVKDETEGGGEKHGREWADKFSSQLRQIADELDGASYSPS